MQGKSIISSAIVAAVIAASFAFPAGAQERRVDPLTRFFDGLRKREPDAVPSVPVSVEPVAPLPQADRKVGKIGQPIIIPAPPRIAPAKPTTPHARKQPKDPSAVKVVAPKPVPAKPASSNAVPVARSQKPAVPSEVRPDAETRPVPRSVSAKPALPATPEEALAALNAHFNGIDQMMAAFSQVGGNGKHEEGTLTLQRPGHFRFAYSAPSTLEIISDGRNVAIKDRRLRTNDVYPVNQTPLKFLVQEHFDLARHTKVRNVQIGKNGMITALFEDSSTLGGTSIVELTYDARADRLIRWVINDPQGYRTTVDLHDVEIVKRLDQPAN